MILLFLGSWRSTLIIAVSIPLSILCSIMLLSATNNTLNVMTLGGLALAIEILVDDATVTIENIHRHMGRKTLRDAVLEGASQIAVPTFVSTLTICIVFVSVVFLTGPAKYLFTPMALAVVFGMIASYITLPDAGTRDVGLSAEGRAARSEPRNRSSRSFREQEPL